MQIQSVKQIYFSPTGTTKTIVENICKGLDVSVVETIDITKPLVRSQSLQTKDNELLVVGVPVYMGRVPAIVSDWLNSLKAQQTPAVCVVVYGNRGIDNSLLELNDMLVKQGCVIIAGAEFIGEHSFSSAEMPVAIGRPDVNDINRAVEFGRQVNEKLIAESLNKMNPVNIPGSFPYGRDTVVWSVDFIATNDQCNNCGLCVDNCPVDAIDPNDVSIIDIENCITCCACIKNCPHHAKSMKPGQVKDTALKLSSAFKEQKEAEFFV